MTEAFKQIANTKVIVLPHVGQSHDAKEGERKERERKERERKANGNPRDIDAFGVQDVRPPALRILDRERREEEEKKNRIDQKMLPVNNPEPALALAPAPAPVAVMVPAGPLANPPEVVDLVDGDQDMPVVNGHANANQDNARVRRLPFFHYLPGPPVNGRDDNFHDLNRPVIGHRADDDDDDDYPDHE
jgi:hypothetical protein